MLAGALWMSGCATLQPTVLPAGQPVRGESAAYELTPAPGWQRVAPRSGSDLTLLDTRGREGVVVWYYSGTDKDIDKLIAWRRGAIFKRGAKDYREQRFFLQNSDLVPASLARYGFPSSVGSEGVIQVLTVVTDRGAIEVIGGGSAADAQQLTAVLTSLHVLE